MALAPNASAIVTRAKTASFGPAGSGDGQLSGNTGIAVDSGTHVVYVADTANHRIVKFDSSGAFLATWGWGVDDGTAAAQVCTSGCQAGIAGSGAAQFDSPRFVAVDNSAGPSAHHVYVADATTNLVQKFSPSGNLIASWGGSPAGGQQDGGAIPNGPFGLIVGIAADSAGNLVVGGRTNQRFYKFSENGTFLTAGAIQVGKYQHGLAIDPAGNLYGSTGFFPAVWKFSPTGANIGQVGGSFVSGDLAIDPSNGDLYVAPEGSEGSVFLYRFDGSGKVVQPDASTCAVAPNVGCGATDIFGSGTIAYGSGIAIDPGIDTVYVSDKGSSGDRILAYGPAQSFADATASLSPATNIDYFSADISATIDDNNVLPTNWRLEISSNEGTTWQLVESGRTTGSQSGVVVSDSLSGLSLNTEYEFRVTTNKSFYPVTAVTSAPLSFKTLNPPAAAVTPTAAKNVTDSSAEMGALITDNGTLPTNWRLELSADGGTNWQTVKSGATAGGQSNVAVSTALSGLIPNTGYRFRVVANKGSGSAEVVSGIAVFTTVAPPPVITDPGAIQVSDTSARLVGTIDPRNTDTGYVFQYGTTPGLGSSTAPLAIGSGATPITVSQVIGGLSPDTTYYFRLVATNLVGTTQSAGATFHTRTEPLPLPEERAYEQVTPPDKNLGDVDKGAVERSTAAVAFDGNGVGFCTTALFAEPTGQSKFFCASYVSRREPSGWQTESLTPHFCAFEPASGFEDLPIATLSPNVDRAFISKPESAACPVPPLDPAAPLVPDGSATNFYRSDLTADPFGYDLLAPRLHEEVRAGEAFGGGSDDFSHIAYMVSVNQTDPPDSPAPGDFSKLYDWEKEGHGSCVQPGGCLSLISRDTSDEPFDTPSALPGIVTRGTWMQLPNSVSNDGERIYFQSGVPGESVGGCGVPTCELNMREGGAITHHVSASECTSACGSASGDSFLSATPSGDKAFFRSCAKLTDESVAAPPCQYPGGDPGEPGLKLYRWDLGSAPGHRLVDLSVDHEPSDGIQPRVEGLLGRSDDGDTAYFVNRGQLVSGAPTGPGDKLYRWRWNGGSPSVDYLGPYQIIGWASGGETLPASVTLANDLNMFQQRRTVSPDGKYLMIVTKLSLDVAVDRDADTDIYRWDAQGGWLCVSCQLPGTPSGGDVQVKDTQPLGDPLNSYEPSISMSADGRRIFFATPDALVPEDVNGLAGCPPTLDGFGNVTGYGCNDVYEWHDGTVSLISSGTSPQPSILIGASSSGDNVFFFTRERLVGWDTDTSVDIYNARIDGGFPEPPAQPPVCEGEACRGAGTIVPPVGGAGTAVFQGPADAAPKRAKKVRKHRKKDKARKRGKRGQQKRAKQRAANRNRRTGR